MKRLLVGLAMTVMAVSGLSVANADGLEGFYKGLEAGRQAHANTADASIQTARDQLELDMATQDYVDNKINRENRYYGYQPQPVLVQPLPSQQPKIISDYRCGINPEVSAIIDIFSNVYDSGGMPAVQTRLQQCYVNNTIYFANSTNTNPCVIGDNIGKVVYQVNHSDQNMPFFDDDIFTSRMLQKCIGSNESCYQKMDYVLSNVIEELKCDGRYLN